jgi:hypothetical protein
VIRTGLDRYVGVLVSVIIAVPVISLLTAAIGYPMQAFIQARRRKRLDEHRVFMYARGVPDTGGPQSPSSSHHLCP